MSCENAVVAIKKQIKERKFFIITLFLGVQCKEKF
jgi:hypothetical protein